MHDRHSSRVGRIVDKLEQVRTSGLSCFGSQSHGFRLKSVLPERELLAFEARQGIRLPDDYRSFLTCAGNGGAGPYYGIFPLAEWANFADLVLDDRPDDFLARPCPLHPDLEPAADWADRFDGASPYQGTLSLGSQGCTFAMQLVVAGPYAGRIVFVDADGQPPYMGRDPDFLAWYERWLDELLQGYNTGSFGYGPSGGEEEFFRILGDSNASDAFKSEAARAFRRLPRLSREATNQMPALCRHAISGVRAGACATVRSFEIHSAADEAARLLDDHCPEVRREAVWTVMTLDPHRWRNAVLLLLHKESAESVASTAFFKLKNADALPKRELLRIVKESTLDYMRYLAAHELEWSAEDLDLLIRLLVDSYAQVRSSAVLSLRKLRIHSSIPAILNLLAREQDDYVIGSCLKALGEFGDRTVVPALLDWTNASDDFHRLDAIEALAKIGDERGVPIAKAMLQERRAPVRRNANGVKSSTHTISDLVRKSLRESPHPIWSQVGRDSS